MGSLLGALFFQLINSFLQNKFDKMDTPGAPVVAPDQVASPTPASVEVPRTPTGSKVAAVGSAPKVSALAH